MGENVDVKTLAARLRQAGMMVPGGGGPQRLPPPVLERGHHSSGEPGPKEGVHSRLIKPNTGPVSIANGPRFSPGPHGIFPRAPPSHRPNHQVHVRPPIMEADKSGPFREKMVRAMAKPMVSPGSRGPQAIPTPPMRSQRSLTGDVEPLLKPLPPLGPRPNKPKRPPFVNLEPFRKNPGTPKPMARLSGRILQDSNSPTTPRAGGGRLPLPPTKPNPLTVSMSFSKHDSDEDQDTYDDIDLPPPPLPPPTQTQESFSPSAFRTLGISSPPLKPIKPSSLTNSVLTQDLDDDQETYDDIEALPPPPPSPPTKSQDSWSDQHSNQADEWNDSDGSEIYEEVEDSIPRPIDTGKRSKKDIKRQQELEKKEQKERQKKESEYRRRFKLTGNETALHVARVREDWHGGKNDLRVHQGDSVEIIRIDNNPEGRWLARTMDGSYGYISTKCVDMDYEEVKRRFGSFAKLRPDPGLYDDVDRTENYGCDDKFPPPPIEISLDQKTLKKIEKEEREFRKKFKFEGPIQILQYRKVDPNANIKKASGKDLNLVRGETLEVIGSTNEKKVLCRNAQGKYGFVPTAYLLAEETDIYDDIDYPGDVYDNDNNM